MGTQPASPKITLVIPAYNEEKYIGDALQNVQAAVAEYGRATRNGVEIIVVDNNSSDRTAEIAAAHGVKVVFEGKNQIAAARNAGARAARGEILAFLDADDRMSSNLLCLVDEAMSAGHIGGGVRITREKRSATVSLFHAYTSSMLWLYGLAGGLMYTRRQSFHKLGGFDETLYAGEDAKFLLDLKRLGKREGRTFHIIRGGTVTKSTRKFDQYGGLRVLSEWITFLVHPAKARSKESCSFWYDAADRARERRSEQH